MATSFVTKCQIAASYLRELAAEHEAVELGERAPLNEAEQAAQDSLDAAVQVYAKDLLDALDGGMKE